MPYHARQNKKRLIIAGVLLVSFVIFCFAIGYKLPQRDRHSDWTTIEGNTDKTYCIDSAMYVRMLVGMANGSRIAVFGYKNVSVIDSTARLLHTFDEYDDVLIDSFHNRLIVCKLQYDYTYHTTMASLGYAYYPETEEQKKINIIKYTLKETFADFLKRKGLVLEYNFNDTNYHKKDSLYTVMYRTAHKEEIKFFSGLHPIVEKDENTARPYYSVKFYADEKGNIYDIVEKIDTTVKHDSYDLFMTSMNKLYPNWLSVPLMKTYDRNTHNPSFFIADKSTISDNDFNFESGIVLFSPTGGNGRPMRMYFDQNHMNYYGIKLKDSTVYFKKYAPFDATQGQHIYGFDQLNIPASDKDTLAFVYENTLYRVYRR